MQCVLLHDLQFNQAKAAVERVEIFRFVHSERHIELFGRLFGQAERDKHGRFNFKLQVALGNLSFKLCFNLST